MTKDQHPCASANRGLLLLLLLSFQGLYSSVDYFVKKGFHFAFPSVLVCILLIDIYLLLDILETLEFLQPNFMAHNVF